MIAYVLLSKLRYAPYCALVFFGFGLYEPGPGCACRKNKVLFMHVFHGLQPAGNAYSIGCGNEFAD